MLEQPNPNKPRSTGEESTKGSPPEPVNKVARGAPHHTRRHGPVVISPASSGVTTINPGAIRMKP
jgi:hypothetical protein